MKRFMSQKMKPAFLAAAVWVLLPACAAREGVGNPPAEAVLAVSPPSEAVRTGGLPEAGPVASIPERGVYLYPSGEEEGVVLQIGDRKEPFKWRYTTPRQIKPVLQLADYDGDGEEELAAVLYVDSGTGVSISELHVVEFNGAEGSGAQPFADRVFAPEEYLAQLREAVGMKKVMKDGELFGRFTAGGHTLDVGLQAYQKEFGEGSIRDGAGFGNIIHFQTENGRLGFSAALGIVIDGVAEPQYACEVEAAVRYGEGAFQLGDIRFSDDSK